MGTTKSYEDISNELRSAITRIDELSAIPEDLFNLKPDSKSWSADEIFKHICEFNKLYLDEIEKVLNAKDIPTSEKAKFKPGLVARGAIRFMEPPYKIKVSTLAPMYPNKSDSNSKEQTVFDLKESNQKLIESLNQLDRKSADLDRLKGRHPLIKYIPMSITEMILILAAHQRRHLWQTRQTLLKLSGKEY